MMDRRTFLSACGGLLAVGVLLTPGSAEAHVSQRNVKVEFESHSGFAAIHRDLKVYDNGDVELVTGQVGGGSKKVLRLTGAEYTSLNNLFSRYNFSSMPDHFPGRWVPDGPSYSVTYRKTPRAVAHKVNSHMGAQEPRGFTVIKNRLYTLMQRVQENGHDPTENPSVIDGSMNGKTIEAKVGDTLKVRLDGNPTTGYSWKATQSSRSLPASAPKYTASSSAVGSGGVFTFTIKPDRFSAGGTHHFKFAYFRPWEGADHAAKTFSLTVHVASLSGNGTNGATSGPGILDGLGGNH
ncbi:MAG: protease inhibitor I42 family protein [Planctomycetes bacterium]|nr:protease inhibitor I42 family protein [Planctomycetota bacterium]